MHQKETSQTKAKQKLQFIGLVLFCMLIHITNPVKSQNSEANYKKYIDYKARLYSKFMFTDNALKYPPHGAWIPAHKRNPYSGFSTSGEIHWADAGHTIGYLLATLATEYKLHVLNGMKKNAVQCIEDIANVLRTLERLDYLAEFRYNNQPYPIWKIRDTTIYPYPYPKGSLNGFFIRDDIGHPLFQKGNNKFQSEFSKTPKHFSDYGRSDEMSQDQVWNLLQGLALTAKLVDSKTTFIDGEGNRNTLDVWAKKITSRTIKALQPNIYIEVFGMKIPFKIWSIYNPGTNKIVKRGGKPTDLILNARLFSMATAKICNTHYKQIKHGFEPTIELPLPLKGYKHFNDHAKLALAVIGKTHYASSFDSILYWSHRCAKSYNQDLPADYRMFAFPHFPLMYLMLHKTNIDHQNYFYHLYMSYIELRLNQAPPEGPWRSLFDINQDGKIDKNDHPEPFWSAGKRLVKPTGKDYVINPNDPATLPWEYNGLDYMLLYNLFELVRLTHFQSEAPEPIQNKYQFKGWQTQQGKAWKKVDPDFVTVQPSGNDIALKLYGSETISKRQQGTNITVDSHKKPFKNDTLPILLHKKSNQLTIQMVTAHYTHAEIIDLQNKSVWSSVIKSRILKIPLNNIDKETPYLLVLHGNRPEYFTIYRK